MDREKIEAELDAIVDECRECDYVRFAVVVEHCTNILAMLKEPEAIKPYIDIDEAKCPVCKVKLTRQELLGDDILFEDFFDYCPHCGKVVKWNA